MQRLRQDIRFAVRLMLRFPGVTGAALVTLALGTGVNTALFSIVNAVLLRPLPFPQAAELVQIWRAEPPQLEFGSASFARYIDWRARSRMFDEMGAFGPRGLTLTGGGTPERINGAQATASFFRALGATPALGRWFTDDEDAPGGERVVVLSHALWTRRFAGSPNVLGTRLTLNGVPHTIVGIAPASMTEAWRAEAWVPLALEVNQAQRTNNFLLVLARLRDGTSLERARDGMAGVAAGLARDYPADRYGFTILALHDVVTRGPRQALWILLGATGLVLLIACTNVANLLLARAVSRQKEIAIRAAIGAGRLRLLRQLLTETLLLALFGSGLGLLLAFWFLRVFAVLAPPAFPRLASVGLDVRVLLFSTAVAVTCGIASGIAPALHVFRATPGHALRDGGSRGATSGGVHRLSRALVISEIALAVVLVAAAGLTVRSLQRLVAQELGLTREGVLTFSVALPGDADTVETRDRPSRFFADLERRIAAAPGVIRAGAINMLPIAATGMNGQVYVRDRVTKREEMPLAEFRVATPAYFDALGIRLVAGRLPTDRDDATAPLVVIINERLAQALWPNQPPAAAVGQLMGTGFDDGKTWREVIGVVRDVRSRRPDAPPDAETYVPHAQYPLGTMVFTVRTAVPPETLVPILRAELAHLDPNVPMASIRTMEEVITTATRNSRLYSALTAVFGALAAVLAIVGIYSVMSYAVANRTRELAIRAALGASRTGLLRMIVREGFVVSAMGIALGLAGAFAVGRVIRALLYQVNPADAGVLTATAASVALAAVLGYVVPAVRAARVDPVSALYES
jgi:putative ABC transport system permease protein